jgi:hypothetical protein
MSQFHPPLLADRVPLPDLHVHGQGARLWGQGQSEVEEVDLF